MLSRKIKKTEYYPIYKIIAFVVPVMWIVILPSMAKANKRIHNVFFEGTDYELNVYRINGNKPGKTLLLIGGIQGDEPGGFLSADLYADFCLAKGNLIVVPRSNFQSIVLRRRQINEDMNRKFAEDKKNNYEAKIVSILKKLISESDCLLNLHDGSGFYSEKFEGPLRNPKRFGQSIIADCETYVVPDKGETLRLGDMAKSVAREINKQIKDPRHYFHFNNHRTVDKSSMHKEQRKSATYYALYRCGIPAFGIETSKSLPLEQKVRHHNLAINAFMKRFGIVPETPGVYLDRPVLKYMVVSVNDSLPVLVVNQQTIFLNPGDTIMVSHIEANYERGLSADIIGAGTINDMRKKVRITKPTRIVVRKDYYPCGSIYLAFGGNRKKEHQEIPISVGPSLNPSFLFYKIKINDEERICRNYEHVKLVKGDKLEIVDIFTGTGDPSDLEVNFKGYVGDKANNTGEDRGYVIDTGKDLWKRYSLSKKGEAYQVVVTHNNDTVGKMFVDLEDPVLNYIILRGDDKMHCLIPGDAVFINDKKPLRLIDIITNFKQDHGLKAFIASPGSFKRQIKMKEDVTKYNLLNTSDKVPSCPYRIDIKRDEIVLGSVFFNFLQGDE